MTTKQKFYSLNKIKKKNAVYNVIFGERSNGKTYAVLKEGLEVYLESGGQIAVIRRWKEDITGKRASGIWNALNENDEIRNMTEGEFEGVHYYNGRFFLCTYENGKVVYSDEDCIGYVFALSDMEHNKSISYPKVKTIMFDEFLTKHIYLQDEFVLFMNTISTIVRQRNDVTIYMLGNTVNKYCPYFQEMGLNHILKMEQGTIDVYKYGNSKLTVAVEYCASTQSRKQNNFYFAFDNPKLEMITGGAWELNIYPHVPIKFKPKDIQFIYFIEFNDELYQCEIVSKDDMTFTYIHVKTTPIQNPDSDLIYTMDYVPKMNYNRSIFKPINNIQKKVLWYFETDRVYYQNNEVGDAISNYLKVCRRG
jgi:hypothetical protein